jgi:transposase
MPARPSAPCYQTPRYQKGGGASAQDRVARQELRLAAVELFASGLAADEIAARLGVTTKSVRTWRRAWRAGGADALLSKGSCGRPCRLDHGQIEVLKKHLAAGPQEHGWADDPRWTLARIADLVEEKFGVRYSERGLSFLLHRMGYEPREVTDATHVTSVSSPTTWVKTPR